MHNYNNLEVRKKNVGKVRRNVKATTSPKRPCLQNMNIKYEYGVLFNRVIVIEFKTIKT